jgi:hypothetical protein
LLGARGMSRTTRRTLFAALALAFALPAPTARALALSGITVSLGASNTADTRTNAGANRVEIASTAGLVGSAPAPVPDVVGASVSFDARYAGLLALDREAGGGSTARSATSEWTITFTIDNPLGLLYQVDIDTSRLGALTLVDDGGGGGTVSLGAVTGLLDGVADPALALPALADLTGNDGGDQGFAQTGTTLSLVDSAPSRTFTLVFSWSASVTSSRDEGAVRLGVPGTLTGVVTADDYPGVGGRPAADDGHFVRVGVTILPNPVPSPSALELLLTGFALFALRRR